MRQRPGCRTRPVEFEVPRPPRILEAGTILEHLSRWTWNVRLTDEDDAHRVTLARDGEQFTGCCDCNEFEAGEVCSHLWALERAERHLVIEVEEVAAVFDGGNEVCRLCGGENDELAGAL